MSTVEMAVERVRRLADAHARRLLAWLESEERLEKPAAQPLGAQAMLGFARRLRYEGRSPTIV